MAWARQTTGPLARKAVGQKATLTQEARRLRDSAFQKIPTNSAEDTNLVAAEGCSKTLRDFFFLGSALRTYFTSKIASISTAAPVGSAAKPSALRAW